MHSETGSAEKPVSGAAAQTPQEIVYQICRRCAEKDTRDDCSVVALRIIDADEIEEEATEE